MSRSFIEAEFYALTYTVAKNMWIKMLYVELKIETVNPLLIFCDNVST